MFRKSSKVKNQTLKYIAMTIKLTLRTLVNIATEDKKRTFIFRDPRINLKNIIIALDSFHATPVLNFFGHMVNKIFCGQVVPTLLWSVRYKLYKIRLAKVKQLRHYLYTEQRPAPPTLFRPHAQPTCTAPHPRAQSPRHQPTPALTCAKFLLSVCVYLCVVPR